MKIKRQENDNLNMKEINRLRSMSDDERKKTIEEFEKKERERIAKIRANK